MSFGLNIYTVCLASIGAHASFSGLRLALAIGGLQLTQSPTRVGIILMAYALLPALLSPRLGRLADRHGVRGLLTTGLSLLTASGVCLWFLASHYAVMVVAAAAAGLGFNCCAISIQKLIGELPALKRQQGSTPAELHKLNFGTLATSSSISAFSGPLLAGWAIDQLPKGAVYAVLAILPVLAGLISLPWRISKPDRAAAQRSEATNPQSRREPWLTPALWPLFALIVSLTVAFDVLSFMTPVLGELRGLSATTVGGILSMASLGGFLVRISSGLFIARLEEWAYLCTALCAGALLLMGFVWVEQLWALSLLAFTLGACLGLAQPMTQALMHRLVPPQRVGEALGARLAFIGAAQAATPPLLGLGVSGLGPQWPVAGAALLLILVAAYAWLRPQASKG